MDGASERCYHCGSTSKPTPEGYCASCAQKFLTAEEGLELYGVAAPPRPAGSSSSRMLIRLALVLVVFPTLASVIRILVALVLTLPMVMMPEAWQLAVVKPFAIFAVVVGLVGSFFICRRFWPSE